MLKRNIKNRKEEKKKKGGKRKRKVENRKGRGARVRLWEL